MTTAIAERTAQQPILLSVTDETIAKMAEELLPLKVNGLNDKTGLARVVEARKRCVKVRNQIENTRKELKAESLERGRRIDSEAKRLQDLLAPVERHLTQEEDAIEAEKQRIRRAEEDAIYAKRLERLTAAGGTLPEASVRAMGEFEFEAALKQVEEATRQRKWEEARAAAAEVERKQKAEEEAERNRVEAQRLADERAALDRQKAGLEESQRTERERLAQVERDQAAERERLAAEQRRLDSERLDRERVERERIEQKERERLEREAEAQRVADEEAARIRAEQLRPDREKLAAYADALILLPVPDVSGPCRQAAHDCKVAVEMACLEIKRIASKCR